MSRGARSRGHRLLLLGGERDADHLQAPAERREREAVDLIAAHAEDLVLLADLVAAGRQHTGGDRDQLGQPLLDARPQRRVLGLLLEVPGAVGDVAVLVLRDLAEALEEAGQDAALLEDARQRVLARERERALDDHVVDRHEVDLGLDVRRVGEQPPVGVDQHLVEEVPERLVEVLAGALEPGLERAVVADDLRVEVVEVLGVARLVHLLRAEERLLALALVRTDEAPELGGDALLADEEGRQEPDDEVLVLALERRPVLAILREVDRVRRPGLALPQLVELLGLHQLDLGQLRLVGDRPDVALLRELEQGGHGAILPGRLTPCQAIAARLAPWAAEELTRRPPRSSTGRGRRRPSARRSRRPSWRRPSASSSRVRPTPSSTSAGSPPPRGSRGPRSTSTSATSATCSCGWPPTSTACSTSRRTSGSPATASPRPRSARR